MAGIIPSELSLNSEKSMALSKVSTGISRSFNQCFISITVPSGSQGRIRPAAYGFVMRRSICFFDGAVILSLIHI